MRTQSPTGAIYGPLPGATPTKIRTSPKESDRIRLNPTKFDSVRVASGREPHLSCVSWYFDNFQPKSTAGKCQKKSQVFNITTNHNLPQTRRSLIDTSQRDRRRRVRGSISAIRSESTKEQRWEWRQRVSNRTHIQSPRTNTCEMKQGRKFQNGQNFLNFLQ